MAPAARLALLLVCLQLATAYRAPIGPPRLPAQRGRVSGEARAPIDSCEERWRTATLDHFSWVGPSGTPFPGLAWRHSSGRSHSRSPPEQLRNRTSPRKSSSRAPDALQAKPEHGSGTFQQRYFFCDTFWHRPSGSNGADGKGPKGPIFFYVGNEADVQLYLNNTGLMWENAPQYGALLVFAEHRCAARRAADCSHQVACSPGQQQAAQSHPRAGST